MILIKVGKLSFKFAVLLFFGLVTTLFLGLENAKADEDLSGIIINEVMANPQGDDGGQEWVEIANFSFGETNLENWQLSIYNNYKDDGYKDGSKLPKIISLPNHPFLKNDFYVYHFSSRTLNNSAVKIILSNPDDSYNYQFTYDLDVGDGSSMEIIGPPYDIDYQEWLKSSGLGGTPGAENSVSNISPPQKPKLLSPQNNQTIATGTDINFKWEEELIGVDYEVLISRDKNVPPNIELNDIDEFSAGVYYWQVMAKNILNQEEKSDILSFEIIEPVYSTAITINEVMPNPEGDDATGEWIELYNSSIEKVNLKNWIFQDSGISQHEIKNNLWIEPQSYLAVFRDISGLSLNNDGDEVKLYQPNGVLLSNISYAKDGGEGLTWARGPNGIWSWTTTSTPKGPNIITLPEAIGDKVDELVINTVPIEIQTGEIQNYLGKLVKIMGEVISTSGNTFFIDDGSGEVKVYIQTKTGIKKPAMHKNDIFEIIGVVDIYGQTWRILPRNQDDIRLIEAAATTSANKKITTKKVVAKAAVAKKSSSGKVAAAATAVAADKNQDEVSMLDQLAKTFVSLAMLSLIFLIIKIRYQPKEKIVGGNFGSDETCVSISNCFYIGLMGLLNKKSWFRIL